MYVIFWVFIVFCYPWKPSKNTSKYPPKLSNNTPKHILQSPPRNTFALSPRGVFSGRRWKLDTGRALQQLPWPVLMIIKGAPTPSPFFPVNDAPRQDLFLQAGSPIAFLIFKHVVWNDVARKTWLTITGLPFCCLPDPWGYLIKIIRASGEAILVTRRYVSNHFVIKMIRASGEASFGTQRYFYKHVLITMVCAYGETILGTQR